MKSKSPLCTSVVLQAGLPTWLQEYFERSSRNLYCLCWVGLKYLRVHLDTTGRDTKSIYHSFLNPRSICERCEQFDRQELTANWRALFCEENNSHCCLETAPERMMQEDLDPLPHGRQSLSLTGQGPHKETPFTC